MSVPAATDVNLDTDDSPVITQSASGDDRSLREMLCILAERMRHLATRTELGQLTSRVAVLEERMSHTATKTWVLGGVIAVLVGVLGGFWWTVQQYLAPILRAAT